MVSFASCVLTSRTSDHSPLQNSKLTQMLQPSLWRSAFLVICTVNLRAQSLRQHALVVHSTSRECR